MAKEKEFTRLRDELSRQRRELPWEKVTKAYVFDGLSGKETLADLFDGRRQLAVYHFMFAPDWEEGCPSCSFWADNFNGIDIHLAHRDITFLAISRAPSRSSRPTGGGWAGASSGSPPGGRFQPRLPGLARSRGGQERHGVLQLRHGRRCREEMPGVSVFAKDQKGDVYHTYSVYSRGIDLLNGAYNYIDLTPKGRDEDGLPSPMPGGGAMTSTGTDRCPGCYSSSGRPPAPSRLPYPQIEQQSRRPEQERQHERRNHEQVRDAAPLRVAHLPPADEQIEREVVCPARQQRPGILE